MPSWKIHLKIAGNVADKLNIYEDKDQFFIGNIIPDMYSGHILKNVSQVVDYETSHYSKSLIINGGKFILPDYERFKNIHLENISDLVVMGYLAHLMTDYFFNKYTYTNSCIIDKIGEVCAIKTKKDEVLKCGRSTMTRMKQEDFKSYEEMIRLGKQNITYNSDIFKSLENIKAFKVQQEDIVSLINYLNLYTIPKEEKDRPLILFSKETLDNMVDECSRFILDYLNNITK